LHKESSFSAYPASPQSPDSCLDKNSSGLWPASTSAWEAFGVTITEPSSSLFFFLSSKPILAGMTGPPSSAYCISDKTHALPRMRSLAVYAAFSTENSVFLACGIDWRRKTSVTKATLEVVIAKPLQKSKIAASNIRICANRINDSLKLAARDNLLFQKLIKKFLVKNP